MDLICALFFSFVYQPARKYRTDIRWGKDNRAHWVQMVAVRQSTLIGCGGSGTALEKPQTWKLYVCNAIARCKGREGLDAAPLSQMPDGTRGRAGGLCSDTCQWHKRCL